MISEQLIRERLADGLQHPSLQDVHIHIREGMIQLVLEVDADDVALLESWRLDLETHLSNMEDVTSANVLLTRHEHAQKSAPKQNAPAHQATDGMTPIKAAAIPADGRIPGVERIIAIASGKGGVGKSTVTSNLAVAMARQGLRVGLLDADIYGPSQPHMLGVKGRPQSPDGQRIMPLRGHGVTMMSIGLMTPEDRAVIWRGPMLIGALEQMLHQVMWGRLDVLLVDLPPGTGDVQLTLAQKAQLDGVVIVSTPQDVALLDARKAMSMCAQVQTPIIGLVENMSYWCCSQCGHRDDIFGHGGVEAEAQSLNVPYLGGIPLDRAARMAGDAGAPVVLSDPEAPSSIAFLALSERIQQGASS